MLPFNLLLSVVLFLAPAPDEVKGTCEVTVLSADVAETWEGTASHAVNVSLILCREGGRYLALGFQGLEPFPPPRTYRVGHFEGMRLRASMTNPYGGPVLRATGGEVRLTHTRSSPVTGYFALEFEDAETPLEVRGTFSAYELRR